MNKLYCQENKQVDRIKRNLSFWVKYQYKWFRPNYFCLSSALWCPTHIVLCFCFVCSVLLPASLDFSFLIAPSVFFDIYCECCTYLYHALVVIAIPNDFNRIVRRLIFDRSKLPLCDIIVHIGHGIWLKYRWSEVNIETI